MNRLRHLTYANVCATLALFVAVSTGGAYAKSTMIDGRTIKPNSIPASALQNNSVTSAKIKNGQVVGADVKKGSLAPTVFNEATQTQLRAIGGSTGTDPNTTTGGGCQPGAECSPVNVVPSGEGLPCRPLGTTTNGVWKNHVAFWLCTVDLGGGATTTVAPATAGSYGGAINA